MNFYESRNNNVITNIALTTCQIITIIASPGFNNRVSDQKHASNCVSNPRHDNFVNNINKIVIVTMFNQQKALYLLSSFAYYWLLP